MRRLKWETVFWKVSFYEINDIENFDPSSLSPGDIVQIKVPSSNYTYLSQLQALGFVFSEGEVIYEKNLISNSLYNKSLDLDQLQLNVDQQNQVLLLAQSSFLNSRYNCLFPKEKVSNFYKTWAENALNKSFDDQYFTHKISGQVSGFISGRVNQEKSTAKVGLIFVSEKHRGKKIG